MRVLVCGGRTYNDQERAFKELDAIRSRIRILRDDIELVIEGGASGADRLARYWALARGIPCMTIHACWDAYGKKAGHKRNEWMLRFGAPNLVLAFPGGAGTNNMKIQARAAEIRVQEVE